MDAPQRTAYDAVVVGGGVIGLAVAWRRGTAPGPARGGRWSAPAAREGGGARRRLYGFQRELGLDVEWLTGRDLRALEPRLSPRVSGGILAPEEAHVEPRAVVRALRAA